VLRISSSFGAAMGREVAIGGQLRPRGSVVCECTVARVHSECGDPACSPGRTVVAWWYSETPRRYGRPLGVLPDRGSPT